MEEKPKTYEKPKYKKPKCVHGSIKSICKLCGGGSICPHQTRKSDCKICGGSAICIEHNRKKSSCKECMGTSICQHNKRRAVCLECKGKSICEHNKRRTVCKECKGTSICEHNKKRSECKECKGSGICNHGKLKRYCKECGGSRVCKTPLCETIVKSKYNGYCLYCYINMFPDKPIAHNYKTKENDVTDRIKEAFPNLTWIADKKVKDGCSLRRPDLLVDMGTHIIIIEVDENKHSTYDCSCENKRLMEISQDVGHRPIVFIRFNPDGYTDQAGTIIKSCWKLNKLGVMQIIKNKLKDWEERINSLKQQIQYWVTTPTEKTIEIIELYY